MKMVIKKSLLLKRLSQRPVIEQKAKGLVVQRGLNAIKDLNEKTILAQELFKKGFDYINGENGVSVDERLALDLLLESASLGNSEAMVSLGDFHELGMLGLSQNYIEAFKWYEKAANCDSHGGVLNLARMYQYGYGVIADIEMSLKLYEKLANEGDEYAMYEIIDIFYAREGMSSNSEQKVLPVLIRLFDAAFRLGFIEFKIAAKFLLDTIRDKLGNDIADAISIDNLQAAYIFMSHRYGEKATSKRDVISVETKAKIEVLKLPPSFINNN